MIGPGPKMDVVSSFTKSFCRVLKKSNIPICNDVDVDVNVVPVVEMKMDEYGLLFMLLCIMLVRVLFKKEDGKEVKEKLWTTK
mmetsp:Transcript_28274/g.34937  ORF Transcript_28274/g.34937 Transcript_28274/m.34937 type:complete len:83 (-) Transcript_28274:303-551(-)